MLEIKLIVINNDGVITIEKSASADTWNNVLDKISTKQTQLTADKTAVLVDENQDNPDFVNWALHG